MEFLDLPPIAHVSGTVRMPGSKSISNRMLLLAALATGTTELDGLLESDDTKVMLDALVALGIRWHTDDANRYVIAGAGGPFPNKQADLFLGLSGLSMRTLAAVIASARATIGSMVWRVCASVRSAIWSMPCDRWALRFATRLPRAFHRCWSTRGRRPPLPAHVSAGTFRANF
jgi:3-phosphoshikimate 1-carboxyvinyltransferase